MIGRPLVLRLVGGNVPSYVLNDKPLVGVVQIT